MLITEDISTSGYIIHSYTSKNITINDKICAQSLIVSSTKLITDWRPNSLEDLVITDFEPIIELKPELVLLGTGTSFKIPKASLLTALEIELNIEVMSTPAACRSFNALSSEGRKVIAALIIDK